jgi:hypothetical protein
MHLKYTDGTTKSRGSGIAPKIKANTFAEVLLNPTPVAPVSVIASPPVADKFINFITGTFICV